MPIANVDFGGLRDLLALERPRIYLYEEFDHRCAQMLEHQCIRKLLRWEYVVARKLGAKTGLTEGRLLRLCNRIPYVLGKRRGADCVTTSGTFEMVSKRRGMRSGGGFPQLGCIARHPARRAPAAVEWNQYDLYFLLFTKVLILSHSFNEKSPRLPWKENRNWPGVR